MAALKNGRAILCDLYLAAAEIEFFAILMRALSVLAALMWRLHDEPEDCPTLCEVDHTGTRRWCGA
jgi:hypothetical protein